MTNSLDHLLSYPEVYAATLEADELFVEAMRDACLWHYDRSTLFRNLCIEAGFRPSDLRSIGQVPAVPHVFVNVFKHHELPTVPREDIVLTLTSSGTTGQKSQIFFDQGSLDRGLGMVDRCFTAMGLRSDRETNYVLFAYDPEEAKNVGTSYTDDYLTTLTPRGRSYHALRWNPVTRAFEFRETECLDVLESFAKDPRPVRFVGFPAFLHRLIETHRKRGGTPFRCGPESFVLTGGGWKTASADAIDKADFVREASEFLGIPPGNIRDGYGLVEHGVPYLECESHRFHVPVFARAFARDVGTLDVLPDGEAGFLHLVTPYLHSMPAISLLTSDLAAIRRDCPCGRRTATIDLKGRAGTKKNKGCAITAAELLK